MKKIQIGITGVCGFIGSNLARKLTEDGYSVVGLDNVAIGTLNNIGSLKNVNKFHFIEGDTSNLKSVKNAFKNSNVIFHLASKKIPRYGNRLVTLKENSKGMMNILETAVENNSKVIFSSTSDVYGKNERLPFFEDSDLVLGSSEVARWAYAASKIFDEQLCFGYSESYKLNITIARLFGVYGPFQNKTWTGGPHLVFADSIKKGKAVEIHGNGLQTRSFVYIDDVIDAFSLMLGSKLTGCHILNIGTTEEITILNLAKLISSKLNKKFLYKKVSYTKFTGKKYEDVMKRKPSVKKAKDLLGWRPKVSLSEGLDKTLDWYINQ